jgi:hypothetical protein
MARRTESERCMNQLANFLPEYSFPGKRIGIEGIRKIAQQDVTTNFEVEELSKQKIQFAYEKGRADAELRLAATHVTEVEQLHSDFADHLIVEKQRWIEGEASKISKEFQGALERIQLELSELLYRTVKPFLKQKIVSTALAETKEILLEALKGRENIRLKVCGPEDWVSALKAALQGHDVEFVTIEKLESEVQLSCDNFAITTQINSWLKKIEEVGVE